MKKNILYLVVGYNPKERMANGVCKKIEGQCKGIIELGYRCDELFIYGDEWTVVEGSTQEEIKCGKIDLGSIKVLFDNLNVGYNAIYARNYAGNKVFEAIIKEAKKLNYKILVEIPTYPILEEQIGKAKQKFLKGKIFGGIKAVIGGLYIQYYDLPHLAKYIDRYVMVSSSDKIKNCECVRIENGINIQSIKEHKNIEHEGIALIGVANINYWHGYDRIIRGLAEYYKSDSKCNLRPVTFKIIGAGEALDSLKKLVKELELNQYVYFLGKKFGEQLDEEFDKADIGVGSIALHRKKLTYASSLKLREYTARGIPHIITNIEKEKNEENKPIQYQYIINSDEKEIDIKEMLEWHDSISCIEHLNDRIRNYAVDNYQWKSQMKIALSEVI